MQLRPDEFQIPTYTREFAAGEYLTDGPGWLLEGDLAAGAGASGTIWADDSEITRSTVREHSSNTFGGAVVEWQDSKTDLDPRDKNSVETLLSVVGAQTLYIDITALPFQTWAPIVRSRLDAGQSLRVLYREAERYRFSSAPTDGDLFDLSNGFEGITQIPGFVSLEEENPKLDALIPLLGFEGQRLLRVLNELEGSTDRVYPIIGVPGFRVEFPFYSYLGNQLGLRRSDHWKRVRFARSNCPFGATQEILSICESTADGLVKVATIGTKPHCLAAVLAWRKQPDRIQIIHDRPRKKDGGRQGAGRFLVFDVSEFVKEQQ